jgi:hypothetical protein
VDGSADTPTVEASVETSTPSDDGSSHSTTAGSFNVFDHIPMFSMYGSSDPANYTPPAGVLMWHYGTIFVTKLSAQQQALIGSDLAAQVTYYAQCDVFDRIGGVFLLIEPKGQMPQPADPRIELVRFITPFSDYRLGPLATHAFPRGTLAAFANVLADGTRDVWIGIGGGSYPNYPNGPGQFNPCTNRQVPPGSDLLEVGFSYSLDFVSTLPLTPGAATAISAFTLPATGPGAGAPHSISNVPLTSTPIQGTITNPGTTSVSGHVTIIVSGHGAAQGGDEYEYTQDSVELGSLDPHGGTQLGTFSTMIDCAPYASASPDGNPGLFQGGPTNNPRSWCPGSLVASHTFPATLAPGSNNVVLSITPGQVPSGSYFQTSITFTSP